jgi:hypothetical protein
VDGIAPDLYHSVSPDGAAIHEAVADMIASLISLDNRELLAGGAERTRLTTESLLGGTSRFSRIAEEFGRWRGHGTELRDLNNHKTLAPGSAAPNRVDPRSAHSLSEVLSGALYQVMLSAVDRVADGMSPRSHEGDVPDVRLGLMRPLQARIGSLICKGLHWLPPGDVGLADFVRSMLAADEWHRPDEAAERRALAAAAVSRGIATAGELRSQRPDTVVNGDLDFSTLAAENRAAKALVAANRELFGLPRDRPFVARVSPVVANDVELGRWLRDKGFRVDLDSPDLADRLDEADVLVVKAGWWESEPNDLGEGFASTRERMIGSTLALARDGRVVATLCGGRGRDQSARRADYLRHLARSGALLPPGRGAGPDGGRLDGYLHAAGHPVTRIEGGFRALHLADAPP